MLRLLAAFVVLFLGGVAAISLLPSPPKAVAQASVVATQLHAEAKPAEPQASVRVVYPASGTEASSVLASEAGRAAPSQAQPAPAPTVASVYPQVPAVPQPVAFPAAPPDASAQAGTKNVNLNTASIEELNNIPGVGRIGRTIASHRPYSSVEDLLRKRVVKKSIYDRLKDQVAAE